MFLGGFSGMWPRRMKAGITVKHPTRKSRSSLVQPFFLQLVLYTNICRNPNHLKLASLQVFSCAPQCFTWEHKIWPCGEVSSIVVGLLSFTVLLRTFVFIVYADWMHWITWSYNTHKHLRQHFDKQIEKALYMMSVCILGHYFLVSGFHSPGSISLNCCSWRNTEAIICSRSVCWHGFSYSCQAQWATVELSQPLKVWRQRQSTPGTNLIAFDNFSIRSLNL